MLLSWFAARAVTRLRCPPLTRADLIWAVAALREDGPAEQLPYVPGELTRALRVYDCA